MRLRREWLLTWAVLGGFVALSAALLWPLPTHLTTHLPGDPAGDLGVYVWNLWIFRHEWLDHSRLPLSTDHVFAYTRGADFSLHNYTPLAGLIGTPLMGVLGVVGTFNAVLIAVVALSGFSVYVLARRIQIGQRGAVVAGALFIAAPVITAREAAHFSLVTTAALPLFQWRLLRVLDTARMRDAALVGVIAALASYSDAYFGIYCVLMGLFTVAWRFVRVDAERAGPPALAARRALDIVMASMLLAVALRVGFGVERFTVGSIRIGLETLHTPMLVLVLAATLRAVLSRRPRVRVHDPDARLPRLFRAGALSVGVCTLLMLPPLLGVVQRAIDDRLPETPIFWRSSPRGVDLLAYLVPNPLHPWFGAATSQWFMPDRQDAFPEFVAGFSVVALAAVAVAAWRGALPRFWLAFTLFFGALSLGPFVHIGGVNTYLPGPWAFLRYVPVLGMARAPSRFSIVAALGLALLCGFAVDAWLQRPHRRRAWALAVCALLALVFEMTPVPRPLFSADVPEVYRVIARADESAAVLELPTGIRDGTSSVGDFSASTQYFQTGHGHRLVGGYLSRVSRWRRDATRRSAVMDALISLSEPEGTVAAATLERARRARNRFLARSCVGFVVLDKRRASPALREAAIDVLRLVPVHDDERYELFQPAEPPACAPVRPVRRRLLARFDDPDLLTEP
jgi:hypothetical protein